MRGEIRAINCQGEREFRVDGQVVSEGEFERAFPSRFEELAQGAPGGHLPSCWPMKSDALAVHPRQIGQAVEDARKKGVPTDFSPGGRPIFNDRGHRKAYCAAYGYFDNGAGFGDASPGDFKGDRPDPPDLKKEMGGL